MKTGIGLLAAFTVKTCKFSLLLQSKLVSPASCYSPNFPKMTAVIA